MFFAFLLNRKLIALTCLLWLGAHAASAKESTPQLIPPGQPEGASGWTAKPGWHTRSYAIAAANPLAAQAGQAMLRKGGSAIDAAIAAQMVLGLVEPQSSGIGGGAFLLHFDGQHTQAFDGRETAPAQADATLFLQADGTPLSRVQATVGGRAVGVPGVVSMLYAAHQQHGKLPWQSLFEPAIRLADHGFLISLRMASLLQQVPHLNDDPVARSYFFDVHGKPWPAGHRLKNPEYAHILRQIAAHGPKGLMDGPVAQAIVRKVRMHPRNPGVLQLSDLQNYQPIVREPLCFQHTVSEASRSYRICGMPPPSSGAIAIAQILSILNQTSAGSLPLVQGLPSAQWLHLYAEAARLAFADRDMHIGDPAFVEAPAGNWNSLLAPAYIQGRASLIADSPDGLSMGVATAGQPGGVALRHAAMPAQTEHGTSHLSVVDAYGNALAMTTSVEDGFGSRQMVNLGQGRIGGFLLNNQLTDFSFTPTGSDGKPVANRVEPGKRPRSAMSPTLVFDHASGPLAMTVGSPGGAMIIHFVAKTLYGVLHWSLDMQSAIDLPNFGSMNGPTLLESGRFDSSVLRNLEQRRHSPMVLPLPSGIQGIQRKPDGLFGGADPRREGVVLGD